MDNFILALNVVFPLLAMMVIGYFLKLIKMVDDHALDIMNSLIFRVFMPMLLFLNIYNVNINDTVSGYNLRIIFMVASLTVLFALFLHLIIPRFVNDTKKCSAMIHGMFRSNLLLFGLPITESIYGSGSTGFVALMSALTVPLYNIMAVALLESYRGGKTDKKKIVKGIAQNPLIGASALALIFLGLGIKLPELVLTPLTSMSKIATPLAFIVLGATFHFSSISKNTKYLVTVNLGKLILFPFIVISIALLLGYRNQHIVGLLGATASPSAVSSFTMSKEMDSDGNLAGEIVITTSILSIVTIFIWVYALKSLQLI